tara:strand:- start:1213 stop:2463 length:1251 start_codon:yes stop_codon:yes gene_type:complete
MKTYLKYISPFLVFSLSVNLWIGCEKANQTVMTGLDILEKNNFSQLTGKRVGLITNRTGINKDGIQNIDLLIEAGISLKAIFSPEHGFYGKIDAGKKVQSSMNNHYGVPFYSLYGETKSPTQEMLNELDVLLYDIQDVGLRSYTYISTMGLAMEAAGRNKIEFIILDRPNPINGIRMEGTILHKNFKSFIGKFPIPYIYGLTSGELGIIINEQKWIETKCELNVIKMQNWSRNMSWGDTRLNWVPPSPNVPNPKTPLFMASTGILGELGVFSVGIGTEYPFEFIGAPWISKFIIAQRLNNLFLEDVSFDALTLTPKKGLYKGQEIHGVRILYNKNDLLSLMLIQFYFLGVHNELYPEKNPFLLASKNQISMFDKALGTDLIRKQFVNSFNPEDIKPILCPDLINFKNMIESFLLYE